MLSPFDSSQVSHLCLSIFDHYLTFKPADLNKPALDIPVPFVDKMSHIADFFFNIDYRFGVLGRRDVKLRSVRAAFLHVFYIPLLQSDSVSITTSNSAEAF